MPFENASARNDLADFAFREREGLKSPILSRNGQIRGRKLRQLAARFCPVRMAKNKKQKSLT
jgi:hypothetical protein